MKNNRPSLLADALPPERVLRLSCATKEEALDALLACLAQAPEIGDPEELVREMYHREALMSTGLGNGFGVPHVRLASVSRLVMAAAVNRHGLTDYDALDGQPVRVICMVAARDDQHAEYLRVLAALSVLMKDENARQALSDAKSNSDIHQILTNPR